MAAIEHLKQVITKFKDVPFSIEFVETADTYNCQATIDNCDMLIQVDASIVNNSDKENYVVTGYLDIGKDEYELPFCQYSRSLYNVTEEKGLKRLIDTFLDYMSMNPDKILIVYPEGKKS